MPAGGAVGEELEAAGRVGEGLVGVACGRGDSPPYVLIITLYQEYLAPVNQGISMDIDQ